MKRLFLLSLALFAITLAYAQELKITGTLVDRDTREGVMLATVQLLKADSTYITGVLSDDNGRFAVKAPAAGQ